jgi:uncharacterized protein
MKNRFLLCFAVTFFVLMFLPIRAFSQDKYVFDNANRLHDAEIDALEARIAAIKSAYQFDVVIVAEKSIDADPMVYADDFFDYHSFGSGNGGALLLQVTESRDYWMSTFGKGKFGGETLFTEFAFDATEKHIVEFLRTDDSYGAYNAFIDDAEKYLILASKGRSYNILSDTMHIFIIAALALSFIIALVMVSIWKRQLNNARGDSFARDYIVQGSLKFRTQSDKFLYKTASKTAIPESSSSSHSGSHSSSSGRSHGGRGGKY